MESDVSEQIPNLINRLRNFLLIPHCKTIASTNNTRRLVSCRVALLCLLAVRLFVSFCSPVCAVCGNIPSVPTQPNPFRSGL
eukprot:jgi/Psemu1/308216/fgenesh1_kg.389_\